MNLLLFETNELIEPGLLRVEGERAQHMLSVNRVVPGTMLRVGELGGLIGRGCVVAVDQGTVTLEVGSLEQHSAPALVDIIVAMPRPQILKKVLQTAATMGVRRIMLIRSERVEKSYFATPLLQPEKIKEHLRLGLEQGVSTILPEISVHSRFRRFVEDELGSIVEDGMRLLLGHPEAEQSLASLNLHRCLGPQDRVMLAVGPEGGWREHEVAAFEARSSIARGLRVESAVCSLLGQIDLLRMIN